MHEFVIKAIDDLLDILDSKIEYPTNKEGYVLEHKLYAVVQSREQVHSSAGALMDLINLHESNDQEYKNKIIAGLKTTWHELTRITTRDIGARELISGEMEVGDDGSLRMMSAHEKRKRARENVTDDYLSSVSKAKELSAKVAFQILDRIALLEDPDAVNDEILSKRKSGSIIERYTENG